MKEKYANKELVNELETFSANLELFRDFVDIVNDLVWGTVIEQHEGEDIRKLGCLTKMLSEIAHKREADLESIVVGIKNIA